MLAHQAAGFVVGEDPLPQARILQELHGSAALLLGHHRHFRFPAPGGLANQLLLKCFQRQQQLAHVLLDHRFVAVEFRRSLLDERLPLPGHVEVQCVHVHQLAALHQQVHAQPG